jgi:hypothetical protein
MARTPFTDDHMLPNIHGIMGPEYVDRVVRALGRTMLPGSNDLVTIYHGGSYKGDKEDIKPGDWVALHPDYARQHAEARGSNRVWSKQVPAGHVSWAGTDLNEWFYTPPLQHGEEDPTDNASKREERRLAKTEGSQQAGGLTCQT